MKFKLSETGLALLVSTFVFAPLQALLYAWVARWLWTWFVAPQYGIGPSFRAWVGVFAIASLMTLSVRADLTTQHSDTAIKAAVERGFVWTALYKALLESLLVLTVLIETGWIYKLFFWAR